MRIGRLILGKHEKLGTVQLNRAMVKCKVESGKIPTVQFLITLIFVTRDQQLDVRKIQAQGKVLHTLVPRPFPSGRGLRTRLGSPWSILTLIIASTKNAWHPTSGEIGAGLGNEASSLWLPCNLIHPSLKL